MDKLKDKVSYLEEVKITTPINHKIKTKSNITVDSDSQETIIYLKSQVYK